MLDSCFGLYGSCQATTLGFWWPVRLPHLYLCGPLLRVVCLRDCVNLCTTSIWTATQYRLTFYPITPILAYVKWLSEIEIGDWDKMWDVEAHSGGCQGQERSGLPFLDTQHVVVSWLSAGCSILHYVSFLHSESACKYVYSVSNFWWSGAESLPELLYHWFVSLSRLASLVHIIHSPTTGFRTLTQVKQLKSWNY